MWANDVYRLRCLWEMFDICQEAFIEFFAFKIELGRWTPQNIYLQQKLCKLVNRRRREVNAHRRMVKVFLLLLHTHQTSYWSRNFTIFYPFPFRCISGVTGVFDFPNRIKELIKGFWGCASEWFSGESTKLSQGMVRVQILLVSKRFVSWLEVRY